MIERILPSWAACAEEFGDVPVETLFPEEMPFIAKSADVRRRTFATGRYCARTALGRLGVPPGPIPQGERGAPVWPSGTVGSITHCDGYRAAAVSLTRDAASIGIDAEPHGPLPEGVLPSIAREEEIAALRALSTREPAIHWNLILFSAKESVYKVWFPLTGRWLDFSEASIELDVDGGFTVQLLADDPRMGTNRLTGRWLAAGGFILTAIVLPR
ncbi:4'-phosphopantetheinyl transferase [Microbispora sp. NPDC049125]|uniref:4'-phosphopantetheinyl transferase family protein n=1 Tax=Microbispora sp. NPDC049125 TaxID=3154929 RepID=UPI003466457E